MLYAIASTLFWSAISLMSCQHVTQPDSRTPVANAGPDQVARVGQYVILDGSSSTRGAGDTLIYKWTVSETNPAYVYVDASNPRPTPGLSQTGKYTFRLVVNNGISDSAPSDVVVTVNPWDETLFSDPNLELSVRYALKTPNANITDNMLLGIDTLYNYSSYYKIGSLNGIEKCKSLVVLGMSDQSIADISSLSGLTSLQSLSLDQNRVIADIAPLANLINLQKLNLQSNNISDISPLKDLTKLTFLNLMTNPITDISELRNMTELEQLWLDYSHLTGTSVVSGFTKLNILWMTDCDLTDISFVSTLSNLHLLHIGGNHVSDISVVANCTQLERLYMDRNEIVDITALKKLTNLNLLDLGYNKITNIQPLVDNTGLGEGDAITLTGNPLDSISINQYIPQLKSRGVAVFY
ncbi:MAG: leucine-rich repeat protein [Bacteroidetes bacterium]|nr:leucine-rich repeat protein [Bacteroidota bacterium]